MRAPEAALRPLLHRPLLGFEHEAPAPSTWLEPARPALTLMIGVEGTLTADCEALPEAWIGGLTRTYTAVSIGRRYVSVDVQLTPLGAYRILGRPLGELAGLCVGLDDLLGSDLPERLRETPHWPGRLHLIERFLLDRAAAGPTPTPAVERAVELLNDRGGNVRIGGLAAELGCSRRYLTRRFGEEVGLPPKAIARQIRFAHVCRRVRSEPAAWGRLAAEAGYCDQAHLNRDFHQLAGTTPTEFVASLLPDPSTPGEKSHFSKTAAAHGLSLAPMPTPESAAAPPAGRGGPTLT